MRQTALQNLCIGMEIEGFTPEDVKNKIKSIRLTYYLELDKIKKSSTSGASGNVYQPKVKWFAELNSFIKNVMVKRKTQENTDDAQNKENTDNTQPSAQCGNPIHTNPEPSLSEPRKKRSKISQLSTIVSSMKDMQYDLSKSETVEDEFDIFGKHIAKQLRTLSTEQAILGQEEIQSVITKCRLHDLRYGNMTVNSANTHASDNSSRPSTSSSTYMPLNSPASVDTQTTEDSLNIVAWFYNTVSVTLAIRGRPSFSSSLVVKGPGAMTSERPAARANDKARRSYVRARTAHLHR
ncbi:hypothetical protein PYW07_013911 [Mythimna separata]|uniref:MADF domain-containing protein n=1 Tax=Mythimna separata TaxID=271217 RepID=A0AAD8DQB0_MYTSE|nr:hypothetical protein PYW07_013911 [Mythimna separata]